MGGHCNFADGTEGRCLKACDPKKAPLFRRPDTASPRRFPGILRFEQGTGAKAGSGGRRKQRPDDRFKNI